MVIRDAESGASYQAHALALLLVAASFYIRSVSGLTFGHESYTLYLLPVAVAALSGIAPAVVAILASWLLADIGGSGASTVERILFGVEGMSIALLIRFLQERLIEASSRERAAITSARELRVRDLHGRATGRALQHLDAAADATTVVVLDQDGNVVRWTAGAEAMLGYRGDEVLGQPMPVLPTEQTEALIQEAIECRGAARSGVLVRRDGTRFPARLDVKPFSELGERGFTVAIHDETTAEGWETFRDAAFRDRASLERAVADSEARLAAIERITDPELNPALGTRPMDELLESLRSALDADGVAFVKLDPFGADIVSAAGLAPEVREGATIRRQPADRLILVHNDGAQIEQASVVRWPERVTSLVAMPVGRDADGRTVLEVVSTHARRASEWDVVLVRVVADRLRAATLVVLPRLHANARAR